MGGTAAVIGIIGTVIGAGGTLYKTYQEHEHAEKQEKRLKKERQRAAMLHDEKVKRLVGTQLAQYGAAGVRVGEGTPLDVIEETREKGEEERRAILEGYGYDIDAWRDRQRASIWEGGIGAGGTLLSGVGEYAKSPYAKNPFATI